MKAIGIALSVFGGLMMVNAIGLVLIGRYDLSSTRGIQQFVGGFAGGLILAAIGFSMANRKQPPPR